VTAGDFRMRCRVLGVVTNASAPRSRVGQRAGEFQVREARWLEVPDAALLLEAARAHQRAFPLVAFLLTGWRESEVLHLEVGDVPFDRHTVTFRPNAWRRLKTASSFRTVPLWPQLAAILQPYVFAADRPPSRLLLPSYRTGAEAMVTDFRKLLDAVAVRAGWKPGEIRSKMFRHTYCAAPLQTTTRARR